MNKLLKLAKFMICISLIVLMQDIIDKAVVLIATTCVAAPLYFIGHYVMSLHKKINDVHEYTFSHKSDHAKLEKDIERIDGDMEEMKKQFSAFDHKLDQMMREIKKQ